MIRFIHAADLHLDRPFSGMSRLPAALYERMRDSTFLALKRLVRYAIREQVDFIIIAGDIFDAHQRSIRAQKRFIQAMNDLKQASIPAFVIFGNHDPLGDWQNQLRLPDNVHVFPAHPAHFSLLTSAGEHVHLYGASYGHRHEHESLVSGYGKIAGADYHIGILHGALRAAGKDEAYAPFTLESLADKGFDYWALGHIHKRQKLSDVPPVWYSGSIQGLSIKETGEKGVSLVTLAHHETQIRFMPTADILWKKSEIRINGADILEQANATIQKIKERMREKDKGVFLKFDLTADDSGLGLAAFQSFLEELFGAMNDEETDRPDFVWIFEGTVNLRPQWSHQEILQSPHFIGDLFRVIEEGNDPEEALNPLYHHRFGSRYLSLPDSAEMEKIKAQAQQIVADALLDGK